MGKRVKDRVAKKRPATRGRRYRVGVIGLTHDHVWWNIPPFLRASRTEITAVHDTHGALLKKAKKLVPGARVYRNAHKLLAEAGIDIALVCMSNADKIPVIAEALGAGIHVVTEKPMAADLPGADRILAASRRSGSTLLVNWPPLWSPDLRHIVKLIEKGAIGELYTLRWRCAHQGPKELGCSPYFYRWLYDAKRNGGGALIDYCSYGACLCRWLLGRPSSVTGVAGTLAREYLSVEDNAVLLLRYPKAFGILEASWSQIGEYPNGIVASGTEGTIVPRGRDVVLYDARRPRGRVLRSPALPANRADLARYTIGVIEERLPLEGMADPKIARDAQEILGAGRQAVRQGLAVRIRP